MGGIEECQRDCDEQDIDVKTPHAAEQLKALEQLQQILRASLDRAKEQATKRKLGLQLIKAGYKALATKLHPDMGGSTVAMVRLNQVRKLLKDSLPSPPKPSRRPMCC